MIKLIATDLDNTLLNREGKIEDSSVALVERCAELGVVTAVATGRSFRSAKAAAHRLGQDTPVICYNGCLIKEANGEILSASYVSREVQRGIIDFAHEHGLYLVMYDNDEIVVETLRLDCHNDPDLKFTTYREIGDFRDIELFDSPKLMLAADPEKVPALQAELEERYAGKAYFAQSEAHLIEIMPDGVNKGAALDLLMARLGVTKEETMALGDNTNDALLLEHAGLAVSVANGVPSLKAISDYVCEAERSEGFDEAVRKFVLEPLTAPASDREETL